MVSLPRRRPDEAAGELPGRAVTRFGPEPVDEIDGVEEAAGAGAVAHGIGGDRDDEGSRQCQGEFH